MPAWSLIASVAFEVFEDIRGAVSMYMFIIEEAIQTMNMATWILYKAGLYSDVINNINYIKNDLAIPLRDFARGPVGQLAYPMNLSYEAFAEATIRALDSMKKAIQSL